MKLLLCNDDGDDWGKIFLILYDDNGNPCVFYRDYLNLGKWYPVEDDKIDEIALISEVDLDKRLDNNKDSRFFSESSFYQQLNKEISKHLKNGANLTKNLQNIQHCKTEMNNMLNDIMIYKTSSWNADYFLKIIDFKKKWKDCFGSDLNDQPHNDDEENEK